MPKRRYSSDQELIERLRTKLDAVVEAIRPEVIAAASLAQLTTAAGTLVEKIAALERAAAPDPALERQRLGEVLRRYVTDPALLAAIAADMDGTAGGSEDGAGTAVGPVHSDEGPASGAV